MIRARVEAVVVGAGLMGRWHAHAIRQCGGEVVGVVDPNEAQGALLAKQCGDAQFFTGLGPALEALSPDAVHVCTPSLTHMPVVREALERGCHVLCEKPMVETAGDTRELLALAEASHRLLLPVHQFPFQHGVLELETRRSELGSLVHLEVKLASAGAEKPERDAEEVAAEIVPHCLALTRRVIGTALADAAWHVRAPRDGEWRIDTTLTERESGEAVTVHYLISMSARPTFAEMRVLGTQASALVDLFHGYCVFDAGTVSRTAKAARPFRVAGRSLVAASSNLARRSLRSEPAYPGLNELVRQLYKAIRGQGANPILPDEVRDLAIARDRLLGLRDAAR